MGRPTKLTPAIAGRVLDAIRAGCTREAACTAGPIAPATFYSWVKQGRLRPDTDAGRFVAQLELAELDAERTLVGDWREQARTDWRAAAELLARRFPDRWRRQPDALELSGPGGGPMAITDAERARALADSLREFLEARDAAPDTELDPLTRAADARAERELPRRERQR